MPIYEYRCSGCGHQQEFLQKVSDAQLTKCPQCGQETFSKMVTAAGFQLKGSGWYATDFKNKGTTAAKPAESKGDAGGSSDSAAKGDSAAGGTKEASSSGTSCGSGGCPAC